MSNTDTLDPANSGPILSEHHYRMLHEESSISDEVIRARGYRTISSEAEFYGLGITDFSPAQRRFPALLIPLAGVDGSNGRYMLRPDNPRVIEKKTEGRLADGTYPCSVIKYESQKGLSAIIDCPSMCQPAIGNPVVPLYITEGSKKADALASRGLCAVALQGVWNFKGTNDKGGKTLLTDFDRIAWNGREVRIVFDSDVTTKPQVRQAMDTLAAHAERKGSTVARIVLPNVPGLGKTGIDDWFTAGHTVEQLESLAQMAAMQGEAYKAPPAPAPVADDGAHDEANAQYAAARLVGQFIHVTELGWMQNAGTHWRSGDAEKALDRKIVEALHARRIEVVSKPGPYTDAVLRTAKPNAKTLANARTLMTSILTLEIHKLDCNPDVLNCANGVVDLRTGEVTPHSDSTDQFSYCVPVDYDPDIDVSEVFNYFAGAVTGGADAAKFLFQMLGYGITGYTVLEKFLYVFGPPRSGKGTLIEMLCELFPTLVGITSYATLTQRSQDVNDFRLAELRPCRIVIADEGANRMQFDADRIKYLTGGAPVQVALKHKRAFTFKPQFMPMLVSNMSLQMDVDDDAAWSRPRIIEFPNSHVENEDPRVKAGMKREQALQQFLSLIVDGAIQFYESGMASIAVPEVVSTAVHAHRNESDYIAQWLEEKCVKTGSMTRAGAYTNYKNWCLDAGATAWGVRRFLAALRKKGYLTPDYLETVGGVHARFIHGLSLSVGA